MNIDHGALALDDQLLEDVNGGFNLLHSLANIGQAAGSGFQKGQEIGGVVGPVGSVAGAAGGAMLGALNGLKNEVGNGVSEAVVGLKHLLR